MLDAYLHRLGKLESPQCRDCGGDGPASRMGSVRPSSAKASRLLASVGMAADAEGVMWLFEVCVTLAFLTDLRARLHKQRDQHNIDWMMEVIASDELYSVAEFDEDGSGKVERKKKECPAENCGHGVFMAAHFDRHYCGRCGLTYVYEK